MKKQIVVGMLLVGMFVLVPFSCSDADVARWKADLLVAEAEMAQLEADIAELPEGEVKEAAKEKFAAVFDRVKSLNVRVEGVENDIDFFQAAANETIELIPAPFQAYAALASLFVFSTWRAIRNRRAAKQIVASVDKVLTDKQKSEIDGQGSAAKRIVDEETGKTRLSLPF